MEKRFFVEIEFLNNRKNHLTVWADDTEEAKRLALRDWGNPTVYKNITVTDTKYM